jgi:hypothetical protein
MSQPTCAPAPAPGWQVVLASILSNAWDGVTLALVFGLICSSTGPETGEPSGWRFGLVIAACCVAGAGLAGFGIGLWRVWRRLPSTGSRS